MNLFSRRPRRAPAPSRPSGGAFPDGRKIYIPADLGQAVQGLDAVYRAICPPPYIHMAPLAASPPLWVGDGPIPDLVLTGTYQNEILVFAMWDEGASTRAHVHGLEPLAVHPIFADWSQFTPNLRSIGTAPRGTLGLDAPLIGATYYEDMLRSAGLASGPSNLGLLYHQVAEMFLIKAFQFLEMSKGESAGRRFVGGFAPGGRELPQAVLRALCREIPDVAPYLQDLPERVRGLLLEDPAAPVWDDYVRL